MLPATSRLGLPLGLGVVRPDAVGHLGEVPDASRWNDRRQTAGGSPADHRKGSWPEGQPALAQEPLQLLIESRDAVIVESSGRRAEDRHVLPWRAERLTVANQLAG